jgi:hypothetical protein
MTRAYENQKYAVFTNKIGKFAFSVSKNMDETGSAFDQMEDNFRRDSKSPVTFVGFFNKINESEFEFSDEGENV